MKYQFVSFRRVKGMQKVITLKANPGRIARFFGATAEFKEFVGDGTVWHTYPGFKRCHTGTEWMLSSFDLWIKTEGIKESPSLPTAANQLSRRS